MNTLQLLAFDAWANTSSEGLLVVDPAGDITVFTERLKDLFHLDTIPATIDNLLAMTTDSIPELRALLKTAVRSERLHWGNLVIQRHPSERLTWQQVPLHDDGEFVGTVTIFRDASSGGQDLTKQSFLSMISHDLRTPLSTILGFAELIYNNRGNLTDEEQEEFLGHVIKNANELTQYTQIALDILFLEANLQAFEIEAVLLDGYVKRWLSDAKHRLEASQIAYLYGAQDDPLTRIAPAALHRILDILVGFALEESPSGEPVSIRLHYESPQAHITIHHKAPNLNEDDASVLFQMMHPRDLSESGRPKLHRMQLYVASLLAQRQQGYISLNAQGGGAFEIDLALPLARITDDTGESAS